MQIIKLRDLEPRDKEFYNVHDLRVRIFEDPSPKVADVAVMAEGASGLELFKGLLILDHSRVSIDVSNEGDINYYFYRDFVKELWALEWINRVSPEDLYGEGVLHGGKLTDYHGFSIQAY